MKMMLVTVVVQTMIEFKNKTDYEKKKDGFLKKLQAVEAEGSLYVDLDQEDEQ